MKQEMTIMELYSAYLNLTNKDYEAPEAEVLEQRIRDGAADIYSTAGQWYARFIKWLVKYLKQYTRHKKYSFDIIFNILYYKDAASEPESQDYYDFVKWLQAKICKDILKGGK